ncbi:unnamed protein product [Closterium sp. NIES-54]
MEKIPILTITLCILFCLPLRLLPFHRRLSFSSILTLRLLPYSPLLSFIARQPLFLFFLLRILLACPCTNPPPVFP